MMMRFLIIPLLLLMQGGDKDGWVIDAAVEPDKPYYGITSANGTLGMVSSKEPGTVRALVMRRKASCPGLVHRTVDCR